MEIKVTSEEARVPVTVFHLHGDMIAEEPLESEARQAFTSGARYLLLDMKDVKYVSSAGLRAIHTVFDLFRSEEEEESVSRSILTGNYKSPTLKLCSLQKTAMKSLSLAGYDMFLEIHKNVDEALHSF